MLDEVQRSPIDVFPVSNPVNSNPPWPIFDEVQDPVVAHPDAVSLTSSELLYPGWAWIEAEGFDRLLDPLDRRFWKSKQLAKRSVVDLDEVAQSLPAFRSSASTSSQQKKVVAVR